MNASGLALRGFRAGLHSALALLKRGSTFLHNPALIANPSTSLSITVLFRGTLATYKMILVILIRQMRLSLVLSCISLLRPLSKCSRAVAEMAMNSCDFDHEDFS